MYTWEKLLSTEMTTARAELVTQAVGAEFTDEWYLEYL